MTSRQGGGTRREDEEAGAALQARLGRSAVEIAGELGYLGLTVARVLARAQISRKRFYAAFTDKDECYLYGEREILGRLEAELCASCESADGWSAALEKSLRALAAFLEAEPLVARGVLVESRIAGGEALELHFEVLERLSHAVDSARRENGSRHSPPPVGTAKFVTAAIEESAVGSLLLGEPGRFAASIPDLVRIAALIYFGDGTASGG
jgi:AcrR family transcriptional regulator